MSVRVAALLLLLASSVDAADLKVLFLGDQGHHRPRERFAQLAPVLAGRGVQLEYTERLEQLNAERLGQFDALLLYANIDEIGRPQADALLQYVEGGGGFVPLHCATYCFRNDQRMVALMGAQFKSHGTGVFRTQASSSDHPVMRGFGGFESWDETYVHHMHNENNRTVLEYRVDQQGREPWTWVRTQGEGRVFYTAWGHDQRTWGHPGFRNLLERGIRWAAGDDPARVPDFQLDRPFPVPQVAKRADQLPEFQYEDVGAKIPNYTPGEKWGAQGEPLNRMQQPLPPEQSRQRLFVPEGFEARLFAAEPELGGKPICMAWDVRGRLWVAETRDYPNQLQPPGQGRDRIRICEDTDGDGRADKFTVFAEQLSIPTSIAFHRGGAIVQDGTRTLYLKDTDGDDVADVREVVFSGWNQSDTHGGVSNFQYGLDNWIWAMQGYNQSQPVVRGQQQQGFRMGFFRFRPDGSQLEFIRSTNNNTWGLGISEEGIVFGSTANRNPSVYMPIPNRYYESVRGWAPSLVLGTIADSWKFRPETDRIRQVDQHGGYTAAAGHALYTARAYPQEYWNRAAFVCGPTGHLVGTFVLSRDGADFRSTSPFNLLASDDEWTAPIMAEVGPDGTVWVLDWYNFIVQHNPTPAGFQTGEGNAYESDLRDKRHGRIYRVVHQSSPDGAPMSLAGATPEELVAALAHPTKLWRLHAQRLLVERGERDVVPRLIQLAADRSLDPIGLNVGAIHALWTLHGLGALDTEGPPLEAARGALRHPSAGVRRNAVQVLPAGGDSIEAMLRSGVVGDQDAQVRLAALLALAEMPPSAEAAEAALAALQDRRNIGDRWLPQAATAAAARHDLHFLAAAADLPEVNEQLAETLGIVAEHLARGGSPRTPRVLAALAEAQLTVVDPVLRGMARGWSAAEPPQLTAASEDRLEALAERLPAGSRGALAKLAGRWGSERFQKYFQEIAGQLLEKIRDERAPEPQRLAAAEELMDFAGAQLDAAESLLDELTPQTPPSMAEGMMQALQRSTAAELGETVVEQFRGWTPAARRGAIRLLLSRPQWTAALLEGIEGGQIPLNELTLDQQQSLASHPDTAIRERAGEMLRRGGALPNPDRQRVLEELLPVAEMEGDPMAGKAVFMKQCSKCHVHGGEGTRVGPDLTGMAVHPRRELLTHIIDPSRDVESNFRVYTIRTEEGQVLSGLLVSESKTAIELFDDQGKRRTLLREDIARLIASPKSLMPEGFEKQVSHQQLADLLAFLTQRGRFLPLDLSKFATTTSVRGMFFSPEGTVERLVFPDWSPKEFSGVPFQLVDPLDGRQENVILLHGPNGPLSAKMPKQVTLPCHGEVRAIHMLSGVAGWAYPLGEKGSLSLRVRLRYEDGEVEDHELRNGVHFADYIRRVDVPESQFAFALRDQQIRYLAVLPQRDVVIEQVELIKGDDRTAPIVMAVTFESR